MDTTTEAIIVAPWKRGDITPRLNTALAKAQGEMELAVMGSESQIGDPNKGNGRKYKYANLASFIEASRGPLSKNGLSIIQEVSTLNDGVVVRTILLHESGEEREQTLKMPIEALTAQKLGSAMTYGRRYGRAAILDMAGEVDDDGKSATEPLMPTSPIRPPESTAPPMPDAPPLPGKIDAKAVIEQFRLIGVSREDLANKLGHLPDVISDTEGEMLKAFYVKCREIWRAKQTPPRATPPPANDAPPHSDADAPPPVDPDEVARQEEQARAEKAIAAEETLRKLPKSVQMVRSLSATEKVETEKEVMTKKLDHTVIDNVMIPVGSPIHNQFAAEQVGVAPVTVVKFNKPEPTSSFADLSVRMKAAKTLKELVLLQDEMKQLQGADRVNAHELYTLQSRKLR